MALLPQALTRSFDQGERARLALFYGAIVLIHVVGWGLLLSIAPQYPALVGLGGLAYSFGLRGVFAIRFISWPQPPKPWETEIRRPWSSWPRQRGSR